MPLRHGNNIFMVKLATQKGLKLPNGQVFIQSAKKHCQIKLQLREDIKEEHLVKREKELVKFLTLSKR